MKIIDCKENRIDIISLFKYIRLTKKSGAINSNDSLAMINLNI